MMQFREQTKGPTMLQMLKNFSFSFADVHYTNVREQLLAFVFHGRHFRYATLPAAKWDFVGDNF
jgi:hypothetical protein